MASARRGLPDELVRLVHVLVRPCCLREVCANEFVSHAPRALCTKFFANFFVWRLEKRTREAGTLSPAPTSRFKNAASTATPHGNDRRYFEAPQRVCGGWCLALVPRRRARITNKARQTQDERPGEPVWPRWRERRETTVSHCCPPLKFNSNLAIFLKLFQ